MRCVVELLILVAILLAAVAVTMPVGRQLAALRRGPVATEGRALVGPSIIVTKSERRLRLYADGRCQREYRIGLGFQPVGHKQRQGDGRTPEGRYYICVKNPDSKFYLSLGLSFPNQGDAEAGLRAGLITQAQHDEIGSAIAAGARPPWGTPLGGEIFIHGRGSGQDWTAGCIAMDDADMKELFDLASVGMAVVIQP